jgi:hypothetical protein
METKGFGYASFRPLPQIYSATSDKLKAFGVAVDNLGSLWDEQKGIPQKNCDASRSELFQATKALIRQWSQLSLHEALPTDFSFLR